MNITKIKTDETDHLELVSGSYRVSIREIGSNFFLAYFYQLKLDTTHFPFRYYEKYVGIVSYDNKTLQRFLDGIKDKSLICL